MSVAAVQPKPEVDRRYGSRGVPDWRAVDWQAHQSWRQVRGRWMNVIDIGPTDPGAADDAVPVLLVHGHQGRWAHWLENIPALARHRRVIVPDLPGFGDSEMPADDVTITGYAEALAELLDQLDAEHCAVVGHSMGGFVAAELAVSQPVRVERLVLVAAAGLAKRYVGVPTAFMRHPTGVNLARVLLAERGLPDPVRRQVSARPRARMAAVGFAVLRADRLPPDLVYEYVKGAGTAAAAPAAFAIADYDFADRVEDIRCPTLIVWGDKDRMVPFSCADDYQRRIRDSRLEVFRRTGHCPPAERPARFNAVVEAFLEAVDDD